MDLRVTVAVFVTLFAVAIAMQHGGLETGDVLDSFSNLRAPSLGSLFDTEAPAAANTSVEAEITSEERVVLDVASRSNLTLRPGTATTVHISDGNRPVAAGERLAISGFTGTVTFRRGNLTVDGTTTGIGYRFDAPKTVSLTTARNGTSEFTGLRDVTVTFANATGTVTAGGTAVELTDDTARLDYFDGNLTVQGFTYRFDGMVYRGRFGTLAAGAD